MPPAPSPASAPAEGRLPVLAPMPAGPGPRAARPAAPLRPLRCTAMRVPRYASTWMRTLSMTFQRYPEGFHAGSAGCVRPALSVARGITTEEPGAGGIQTCSQSRQAYGALSRPKVAGCQVRPWSVETSTRVTSCSPAQAAPAMRMGPGFQCEPSPGCAMTDFTGNPVITEVSSGLISPPGGTLRLGNL